MEQNSSAEHCPNSWPSNHEHTICIMFWSTKLGSVYCSNRSLEQVVLSKYVIETVAPHSYQWVIELCAKSQVCFLSDSTLWLGEGESEAGTRVLTWEATDIKQDLPFACLPGGKTPKKGKGTELVDWALLRDILQMPDSLGRCCPSLQQLGCYCWAPTAQGTLPGPEIWESLLLLYKAEGVMGLPLWSSTAKIWNTQALES